MTTQSVNNWGRWGADDEKGMLNLLTPETVLKAMGLVRKGEVYSLAVPLERDGPQYPLFHKTWLTTFYDSNPSLENRVVGDDVITMQSHSGTHIDALGHMWNSGLMYNHHNPEYATGSGLLRCGIENVPWMVGRGVMLDIPASKGVEHLGRDEVVTVSDLDECCESQRVAVEPGDILLIRTGWYKVFQQDRALWETGEPGPDDSVAPWVKEKEIVALGADTPGVEVMHQLPDPAWHPLHQRTLRDLGVYLIENLNLEDLAARQIYEFLFVAAPIMLTGGTGAPTNPLAIV